MRLIEGTPEEIKRFLGKVKTGTYEMIGKKLSGPVMKSEWEEMKKKVLIFLEEGPARNKTISNFINEDSGTVRTMLKELKNERKIKRIANGRYKLL